MAIEKPAEFSHRLYECLCGRELGANLLHFQFLPSYYARRDMRREAFRLRGKVLDLGCGNQPYRPFFLFEALYIGLDYPWTRTELYSRVKPDIYGDARCLPFADQSFDAVLCFQVLEHVNRPEAVIREIGRILKPGGQAFISVPFCYSLHMEPYDFYRFSPYAIKDLLEGQGLVVRQLRGQGGIAALVIQVVHNWLFSGISRKARRSVVARALSAAGLPFLLMLAAFNNLAALALDSMAGEDLRFTPNLWVIAEKI